MMVYDTTHSLWNIIGGTGGSSGLPIYTLSLASGSLYQDSAATPVDGTGGSTTGLTYATETASPLRGAISYKFSKDAANRQGGGVSIPFTIDTVDQASTVQVIFDTKASANFVSGDMNLYVYDVTNGALLEGYHAIPTGTQPLFTRAFNLTTGTSYRVLLHCASTSALAYDLTIDAMYVSSVIRPQVAGIGDWISYTPTFGAGFGTVTNASGKYRREGDNMRIMFSATTGTVAASLATISLPSPFTIDSTKITLSNTTGSPGSIVGNFGGAGSAGSTGYIVSATGTSTSLVYLAGTAGGSVILTPTNGSTLLASTQVTSGTFLVPISQWSSNITLSSTNAAIEYASNSSSTDANDTSSFVSGATGSVGIIRTTALTTPRKKRVQFSTPIQPTDRVQLEFYDPTVGLWSQHYGIALNGTDYVNLLSTSFTATPVNNSSGMSLVQVSDTQVDVVFNRVASMATANGTGALTAYAWNSTNFAVGTKWRVAKYSAIGAAELAPATELSQGTVGYSQWASYTPTIGAGAGTATGVAARYRREGDSLRVKFAFTTGTVAASLVTISLPGSYVIDTTKMVLANTTAAGGEVIGSYASNGLANSEGALVSATGTSTSLVYFGGLASGTAILTPANGSTVMTSTSLVSGTFLIPISGWN